MKLKFEKIIEHTILPDESSEDSNVLNLYACLEEPITLQGGEAGVFPTGLAMELIYGYEAQIRPNSRLAILGLTTLTGEVNPKDIRVVLVNHSKKPIIIENGDIIADMAITIAPVVCFPFFEAYGEFSEVATEDELYGHVPYSSIAGKKTPNKDQIMEKLLNVSKGHKNA